jgi:carbon storage regulator
MLIITRRPGEKLMIGDDVVIEVMEVSGSSVRIGIAAPKSIPVYREEIYSAVKAENTAAAAAEPGQLVVPQGSAPPGRPGASGT